MDASGASLVRETLEGRLPVLAGERVYRTFASVLWTSVGLSAATWAFLIGMALPHIGNKEIGVVAYIVGASATFVLVMLSAGLPTVRYGLELVDASKAVFGMRGRIVPLAGLLITCMGWSYVLAAMNAEALAHMTTAITGVPAARTVVPWGLGVLLLAFVLTSRGPKLFERLGEWVGPGMIAVSAVMIMATIHTFGWRAVLGRELAGTDLYTSDRLTGFMLGVEWGAAIALSYWPIMGGITRLIARPNDLVSPTVLGFGLLGPLFPVTAAALATVMVATGTDPTGWLVPVAGPVLGTLGLLFVVFANVYTIVIQLYLAGVGIQHVRFFTRVRWEILVAMFVAPGVWLAFRPDWVLDRVLTWVTYDGLIFAGIAAVTFVDFVILRRQTLDVRHVFNDAPSGQFRFWSGVNPIAVAVVAFGLWFYVRLYDPVTMTSARVFRYCGATLPTVLASGVLYWILMRLFVIPAGRGGYPAASAARDRAARAADEDFAPGL
jgi:purine-cytosine permease-like protein